MNEWYAIAHEANGNLTICNRQTSEVLMYAHDHSFDHITTVEGYPAYTLYRIDAAPTFKDWAETVATQWLAHVAVP